MKIKLLAALFILTMGCAQPRPIADPILDEASVVLGSTIKVHNQVTVHLMGEDIAKAISGSGSIVFQELRSNHQHHTLILTAKHVCDHPSEDDMPDSMKVAGATLSVLYTIEKQDGTKFQAYMVHAGEATDLCFLDVPILVARPVILAKEQPSIGAPVLWVGAPGGVWGGNGGVGVITDGRYSGIEMTRFHEPLAVLSGVAIGGNSGGPVFYRGQLVGVLIATATKQGILALAVPLSTVKAELPHALKAWHEK